MKVLEALKEWRKHHKFIQARKAIHKKDFAKRSLPNIIKALKDAGMLVLLMVGIAYAQTPAPAIDLKIIAQIESSNNPLAYNKRSGARGMYQITDICLKDYNSQNSPKISPTSLFDPQKAKQVAKWYLGARIPFFLQNRGIVVTTANVLWAYNAGIGKVVKGIMPKETKDYIAKYQRLARLQ